MAADQFPLVSIILCTYNRAHLIGETITSILAQTYKYWDLHVIDNGSADKTADVVKTYDDPRIKYMRIDENIFTGTARNQVIKPLESEYIAFIDDDDLWMADKLEKQIAAMQQNELVGFSYTNGYNFSGNKIVEYILHKNTGVDIDNIFISYCLGERGVFLQSLMCRKECFDLAGYFNENRMFTDFSFMGNLAYHYKAAILYEPLLKRRLHEFNSIHSYTASLKDEHFSAIKEYLHKGMLPKKIARQAFFLTHVKTGNALVNSGKYLQAIKSYLRGWYVKPFSVIPFKKLMRLSFRYISS